MARLRVSELGLWSLVGEVGSEAWLGPGMEDVVDIGVTPRAVDIGVTPGVTPRGPGRRRREVTRSTAATSWTDILTGLT